MNTGPGLTTRSPLMLSTDDLSPSTLFSNVLMNHVFLDSVQRLLSEFFTRFGAKPEVMNEPEANNTGD